MRTKLYLIAFAQNQKVTYRILREFNPWLRKDKLTNSKRKNYIISLPVKGFTEYTKLLESLKEPEDIFNEKTP